MLHKKVNGYTLLEILLSVAVISIIAGLSLPVFQSFQNRNDLSVASEVMVNTVRRAEIFSRAGKEDSQWGVRVEGENIVLFKGNDFSGRNQAFDEDFSISSTLNVSGQTEFIFNKFSGEPQSPGSIVFMGLNGRSETVSINEKGVVNY
ncbi:MAG: type II secretion system protein [Candidatus Moranbacteria bacterium]|nr:type II secretion system protein [Candidatus Moranbacteria bacterium]